MSTTLSTATMVTTLQRKFPIGILSAQWMDFLNEAFRKINQMSKGGFIWQLKQTTLTAPSGAIVTIALPADFDPGKSAFLFGNGTTTPTSSIIPYMTMSEFLLEQDFNVAGIGYFSSWTFRPNFTLSAPTSYSWVMLLAPNQAYPLPAPVSFGFMYHAVNYPSFASGSNIYFPTPDQFDSLILDIAEAEARREFGAAGWEKLAALATQGISDLIDTYRTDRYDLAGLSDVTAQAQEKQAAGDK